MQALARDGVAGVRDGAHYRLVAPLDKALLGSTLLPYTTLFRSAAERGRPRAARVHLGEEVGAGVDGLGHGLAVALVGAGQVLGRHVAGAVGVGGVDV